MYTYVYFISIIIDKLGDADSFIKHLKTLDGCSLRISYSADCISTATNRLGYYDFGSLIFF